MISFNKFIASAGLATAIVCTAGWASARPTVPPSKPAVQTFAQAQQDVRNAPEFCAVTYIRRDFSRGYVAVCELAE